MQQNDWFFGKFEPEYPGDTPNRKWVRDKLAEKRITVDTIAVIKAMTEREIVWLFDHIVQHSYFGIGAPDA